MILLRPLHAFFCFPLALPLRRVGLSARRAGASKRREFRKGFPVQFDSKVHGPIFRSMRVDPTPFVLGFERQDFLIDRIRALIQHPYRELPGNH
jgi:hypothetical protein